MLARLRFGFVRGIVAGAICLLAMTGAGEVSGGGPSMPQVEAPYDQEYVVNVLDEVPGLPEAYAGLTFMAGDPNTLLIGVNAGDDIGGIYEVSVARDPEGHITSFVGEAERYADAQYIDGGLAYGPDGVLFYSRFNFPMVEIGQVKPGSDTTDRVIDLEPLGVKTSPGGLNFVPSGFPGAGMLKLTSHGDGDWYELAISAAGDGTYDVTSAETRADLQNSSENFSFVPEESPFFDGPSSWTLLNESGFQSIAAYELDADGDPIASSREVFVSDADGVNGSVFDPLTGDLLVTDNNNPRLYRVSGFASPPQYLKGDNNCDGAANALDALSGLQFVAGLPVNQEEGCQQLGEPVGVAASPAGDAAVFGDIDCDEDVDAVDSLLILTFVAGLPVNLPQGCAALETAVPAASS